MGCVSSKSRRIEDISLKARPVEVNSSILATSSTSKADSESDISKSTDSDEESSKSTSSIVDSEQFSDLSVEQILKRWPILTPKLLFEVYFSEDEHFESQLDLLHHFVLHVEKTNEIDQFMKVLLELGIVEAVSWMMKQYYLDFFDTDYKDDKVRLLSSLLATCSDRSEAFCRALVTKKFHLSVLKKLNDFKMLVKNWDKSSKYKDLSMFANTMLMILFNTVKKVPGVKQQFREDEILKISLAFSNVKHSLLKTNALMVVTFIADISSDTQVIKTTSSNMKFIIKKLLRLALNSPQHHSMNNEGNSVGMSYHVEEMMEALSLLSKNSDNARKMAELGILDDCENILLENFSEREIILSLGIIWTLSFHDDLRKQLEARDIRNKIQVWKNHSNTEIKKAISGIEWNMQDVHFPGIDPEIQNESEKHVMISYCHQQQALACQISETLKQNGVNVWIDSEQMEGDMFDKMGKAIQNASHVICCVSEDYFNSDPCRSEAEYSRELKRDMVFVKVQQNYRPKDWLGLIMAGKIYYEMYDNRTREENFNRLLLYLKRTCVAKETPKDKTPEQEKENLPKIESEDQKNVKNWSKSDILTWFNAIGCSPNEKTLRVIQEMNGETLAQLCSWKRDTPDFFLKFCQEDFGFYGLDLLLFGNAVQNL